MPGPNWISNRARIESVTTVPPRRTRILRGVGSTDGCGSGKAAIPQMYSRELVLGKTRPAQRLGHRVIHDAGRLATTRTRTTALPLLRTRLTRLARPLVASGAGLGRRVLQPHGQRD